MTPLDQIRQQLRKWLVEVFETVVETEPLPTGGVRSLVPWLERELVTQTPPGSGKTHIAAEEANRLFEEHKLATLILVLSHDVADAVPLRRGWAHWQGHARMCQAAREAAGYRNKGYDLEFWCDCDYSERFKSDRPTVAPLDYIFAPDHLIPLGGATDVEKIHPLNKAVEAEDDFFPRVHKG